eukprot:GHVU01153620.1.p3 GENE.GHVU01153620.1~~GHVU01153620.1.p3  ORF type:complete len:105 (-),score=2.61 GHVU01153620.1:360-674(-)
MDGNKIEKINACKLLGIHIDEKLNWIIKVNKVCVKLKQNLYLLNNVKDLLPKKHLLSLYYAHIYPHLTYGLNIIITSRNYARKSNSGFFLRFSKSEFQIQQQNE